MPKSVEIPTQKPHVSEVLLKAREFETNLNSFHILKYRMVDGFFVSAKNSGTHWLRFMLSAAIAHHFDLPAPAFSSGPESDAFIGHPRHPAKFAQAPRLGSSHNVPSKVICWLGARRFLALPPTVVLVRDIRDAMLSYYTKWHAGTGLSLADYVRGGPGGRRTPANAWWFMRFFDHWGEMQRAFGRQVMVVRYEDVQASPEVWIRRMGAHYGIDFTEADLAAALAVSGREAVASQLDPGYGEVIVPDRQAREKVRLSPEDDRYLLEVFGAYLQHDLGYGYGRPQPQPALRPQPVGGMTWSNGEVA
ncbi:MAG: hypothetical protein JWP35_900 [Caulobacter sp.]|nr:hypothetical protein [Caulobacter sp.]